MTARAPLLPVALLLIGAMRHYAWSAWPADQAGIASKMLGALAALCLLAIVYDLAQRSELMTRAALWYASEETLTASLAAAHLVRPWPVPDGMSLGASLLGFDPGLFGALALACVACVIPVGLDRSAEEGLHGK